MENGKRIHTVCPELPEVIIQHIQSFLNQKEAVLTSVLSKSWYNSWLTSPTLDFDEREFQNYYPQAQIDDEFCNFMKRTMYRYEELNLKIYNFNLWMNVRDSDSSFLASQLIVKALEMGAKNLILEIHPPVAILVLPEEVLKSDSLVRLSIFGSKIDEIILGKIFCSRLKSLRLCKVCISDDVMRDIIANCPLIEEMFLSECEGLEKVNVSKLLNLKKVDVRSVAKQPLPLRIPKIKFDGETVGCQFNIRIFSKLSCLVLERVRICLLFFGNFSVKFPFLENLTLHDCVGCKNLDISSNSLKFISLRCGKKVEAQFDVPNIQKFKFSGLVIPSLSFIPHSKEWESDIVFTCWNIRLRVSWFVELKNFLTNLGMSKISLRIFVMGKHVDCVGDNKGYPKPVLENFMLMAMPKHSSPLMCSALWEGLLWSFKPKFITRVQFPKSYDECGKANHEEFWELFSKKLSLYCSMTTQEDFFFIQDLEGVNIELFEETRNKWKPLSWKHYLDVSTILSHGRKIRFQLRWKPFLHENVMNLVHEP